MVETGLNADQIRRAVIQQLEGLRQSGVTHFKRIDPVILSPQSSGHMDVSPSAAGQTSVPLLTGASTEIADQNATPAPPRTSLFGKDEEPLSKSRSVPSQPPIVRPPFEPLDLPLAERVQGLAILAEKVKACTRCHELASTRTQTVFGVGNPQAKILFVGEAPGADEDLQGEPFVGKSGQLLNDIIKACRLTRQEIYICNVLRCRPPGNRLPAPDECSNCREYLDGQIAHVNPMYIVCWGACAAQNLLGSTESIGKLRRRFFTYGKAKVVCTYHPSYLMRNPSAKKDVWEDMKMLFLDMGVDLTKK